MLITNKENISEAYAPGMGGKKQDKTMHDFWRLAYFGMVQFQFRPLSDTHNFHIYILPQSYLVSILNAVKDTCKSSMEGITTMQG